MTAAAIILYGIAFFCFVAVAGKVEAKIDPLGLGLACIALLWWLQVIVPLVNKS
jgi:hypothetical protein